MAEVADWELLRARVCSASGLYQPAVSGCCATCRGPVTDGYRWCYTCDRHVLHAGGLLADLVVPACYAVTGTPFGRELWDYKAGRAAGGTLLALALTFLHDHASCLSARGPLTRLAVVPSGSGRPGVHPLLRMLVPYLTLPLVPLRLRPGEQGRELNPDRFRAGREAAGARVLLLDDTWVSGASAQSAAVSLKLAGARQVVSVVLARLLPAADAPAMALAGRRYDPRTCVRHAAKADLCPHSGNTIVLAAR